MKPTPCCDLSCDDATHLAALLTLALESMSVVDLDFTANTPAGLRTFSVSSSFPDGRRHVRLTVTDRTPTEEWLSVDLREVCDMELTGTQRRADEHIRLRELRIMTAGYGTLAFSIYGDPKVPKPIRPDYPPVCPAPEPPSDYPPRC